MDSPHPTLPPAPPPPFLTAPYPTQRPSAVVKGILIAVIIFLLQFPLLLVNGLRQERARFHQQHVAVVQTEPSQETWPLVDGYRMVERALKYGVLVMGLIFAAFFLFETLAAVRLHPVHYGLIGAAICLFYLALLALGEVAPAGMAYTGAAAASSLLISFYSAAILRSRARACLVAGLQAAVHAVLFVVLRLEHYALLAGTAALFTALAVIMCLTRRVDWSGAEPAPMGRAASIRSGVGHAASHP